jgi:hypothetical protein
MEQRVIYKHLSGYELVDHVEGDHEREMGGCTSFKEVREQHRAMHRMHNDWDHTHEYPKDA